MKILPLLLLLTFIITTPAHAAGRSVIFWYPGEAGSTKEAQPVLDAFFDYVNTKLGALKLIGKYFNTKEEGLAYIKGQKPVMGIVSYAAWEENKSKFTDAKVLLATNPAPHGQTQETYFLVGKFPSLTTGLVFSSEPLTQDFIKNQLGFGQLQNFRPEQTSQILMKLKSIAEGLVSGVAILSPTEGVTFQKMTSPWTKSLQVIAKSKMVPTARVILFNPNFKEAGNVKQVLLNLKNDAEIKPILEELRLVSFSLPVY